MKLVLLVNSLIVEMFAQAIREVDLVLEDLKRIIVHLLYRLRAARALASSGVCLRVQINLRREEVDNSGKLDPHKLTVVAKKAVRK
jgi:hypothetical protein